VIFYGTSFSKTLHIVKMLIYQRYGVKEYWIVDPATQFVFVNHLINGEYVTTIYDRDKTDVPVMVLENCTIDLAEVFAEHDEVKEWSD